MESKERLKLRKALATYKKTELIDAMTRTGDFLLGQFPPEERTAGSALRELGLPRYDQHD